MVNNTTLRDGNGTLFTAESFDMGSGLQRTSTAANLRVANADVASGNPVPVAEASGTAITGATMPTGGVGLTGWLSAIWSKLSGLLQANLYVGGTLVSASNAVPVLDAYQAPTTVSWTSATAANSAMTIATAGYDTAIFTVAQSGSVTAGAITFEAYDGTNWVTIKAPRTDSYQTDTTFSLAGSGTHSWQLPVAGYPQVRARLSTAITGTGTVNLVNIVSSAPDVSLVTVGLDPAQPLPAGTNTIGAVTSANPTAVVAGQQTATTSAVALPSQALVNGVNVLALAGNTGTIYVGPSGVTASTGYPLAPGQTLPFAVTNLNAIYMLGTNTSDKLAYAGN